MRIIRTAIKLRPAKLAFLITMVLSGMTSRVNAGEYFNPELLEVGNAGGAKADLSAYEAGAQAPGIYHVDIVLNEQVVDTRDVEFSTQTRSPGESHLQPCLSVAQLKEWGVKTELFPALANSQDCVDFAAIPLAAADFQFSVQRLVLSIPQAALQPKARGYVAPELWDEGITAALLNYNISAANSSNRGNSPVDNSNSQYANLRPGINMGPWRLRNYTTWSRDDKGVAEWDSVYTYVQRDIIPLKAQLTAGDSSAPANVFDSIPFRGLQLASDDDMLPDSLKGYAPVVRGIARTNAQVTIRQNGYQIYQNYVAPGAFEISDMYPTGGAGDLDVTIKETDGSEQRFTVPFAALPVLQREGRFKYSVTGGQYRSYDSQVNKTPFAQATGIYGLAHGFTLFGGIQGASHYHSLALGGGKNMGELGALSLDVIQARSKPDRESSSQGQSWRVRYSKNVTDTGTNFAIAGYRYSTRGYYAMQEVLDTYSTSGTVQDRRRNRTELTMSQTLWKNAGAIMISAVREDYWNSARTMSSWSAGYNGSWKAINYGLTYTYSKNGSDGAGQGTRYYDKDQQLVFNISVPLSALMPDTWVNYTMNNSKMSGTTHQVGINGTALENHSLNWNVQEGYGAGDVGNTGNASADYKGTYGEVTTGYGYDKFSKRMNYGLAGGIIAHADGVTLTQPLGETNVLIKAPGVEGVSIQNQSGAKTDWRGYTSASNLTPFRKNDVALLTSTLPDDAELELTTQTVIPTRGAIVRAEYIANVGQRILLTLARTNGQPVPFGAIVTIDDTDVQGSIVGDNGQVYLTGMRENNQLAVRWGNDAAQQCHTSFASPQHSTGIQIMSAQCR